MKYNEYVKPIETKPCSVWLVKVKNSNKRLIEIWAVDAKITDVLKAVPKGSIVSRIDSGSFEIGKIVCSYSGDARKVRTDGEVLL